MVKTRSTEAKIETDRKTIKKPRKPQQKISIPMVLNCDGKVSKLLPLFVQIVDLLSKKNVRNVRKKVNGVRRKKASPSPLNLQPSIESASDLAALPSLTALPPVEPRKSSVRRSRKAVNTKARQAPPGRSRRRRQQGQKRPSFGPRPRRKSLIPPKYFKPTPASPMGSEIAELSNLALASAATVSLPLASPSPSQLSSPCQSQVQVQVPATGPAPAPSPTPTPTEPTAPMTESLLGLEALTDTSNSSMLNDAVVRFDARVMMFMAAQRAALEAFSVSGDGPQTVDRYAGNQIPYNFQEAWNEAVNRQQSELDMHLRPNGLSSLTVTQLRLAAPKDAGNPLITRPMNQPNVPSTAQDCSIFNHIRNSLGEVCSTISSAPIVSTSNSLSESPGDFTVDIYSHIKSNLGDDLMQGNRDSLM